MFYQTLSKCAEIQLRACAFLPRVKTLITLDTVVRHKIRNPKSKLEIAAFIKPQIKLVFAAQINKKMILVSGGVEVQVGRGGGSGTDCSSPLLSYKQAKERKKEMVRMRELEEKPSLQSVAACQSVALLRQVPVLSALSSPIRPLV